MKNEACDPHQLEQLLMPSWARENNGAGIVDQKKYDEDDALLNKEVVFKKRKINKKDFSKRSKANTHHDRKHSFKDFLPDKKKRDTHRNRPSLVGWEITLIPEHRAVSGIAKQVKAEAKAYSLFDLTRLILEKPTRYEVVFKRIKSEEQRATPLIQYLRDGTLWLTEKEAIAHVLKNDRDQFYRSERVNVDPPKGNYSSIAVCESVLLGPPNHHEYQTKVHQLYGEQFSHLPFEVFKNRIQLVKDEEALQRWREEQSFQERYYPLSAAAEGEEKSFKNFFELEEHFKKEHAAALLIDVTEKVALSGAAAFDSSAASITLFLKNRLEELRRFPLSLSQLLAEQLVAHGLQVFKGHENITYVSIIRPHYLDLATTPLAEELAAMVKYLSTSSKKSRSEQWKGLLALRCQDCGEQEKEATVAKDLLWLLHQGYVINYAQGSLEVSVRQ